MASELAPVPRIVGRYVLHDEIASGGMATVHLGRLVGPAGFSRTVAIKRLHAQFAKDSDFADMFLDEARLAARIKHPNVVSIVDVIALDDELFLVMEYVPGESLSRLRRLVSDSGKPMPLPIAVGIGVGMLSGLHAAHQAKDERGALLNLVHRDVSPQNVLIGTDGVPRVIDFGIAKAAGRIHTTRDGEIKGKLAYMAPEQILRKDVDCRTDVYAAAVVMWQILTGQKPFDGDEASLLLQILNPHVDPPSAIAPQVPAVLDRIVMRGMSPAPENRFATALEMAIELENALRPAMALSIAAWVEEVAGPQLERRAAKVLAIEQSTVESAPVSVPRPSAREATASSVSVERSGRSAPLWIAGGAAVAGALGWAAISAARTDRTPRVAAEQAAIAGSSSARSELAADPPPSVPQPSVSPAALQPPPSATISAGATSLAASSASHERTSPVARPVSRPRPTSNATPPTPPGEKDYGF